MILKGQVKQEKVSRLEKNRKPGFGWIPIQKKIREISGLPSERMELVQILTNADDMVIKKIRKNRRIFKEKCLWEETLGILQEFRYIYRMMWDECVDKIDISLGLFYKRYGISHIPLGKRGLSGRIFPSEILSIIKEEVPECYDIALLDTEEDYYVFLGSQDTIERIEGLGIRIFVIRRSGRKR